MEQMKATTEEGSIRPIKVYKTTVSIIMIMVLYIGFILLAGWLIIWAFRLKDIQSLILILCSGVFMFFFVKQMVYYVGYRKDRIVITERHLMVSHCLRQTKKGTWVEAKNVKIPWGSINDIYARWENPTPKSIRKNVFVSVGKDALYMIDPDVYDVFFLERKLRNYHCQYVDWLKD